MIFFEPLRKKSTAFLLLAFALFWTPHSRTELYLNEAGCIELPTEIMQVRLPAQPKKKWTVLIYIAADNDLYPFAYRNLAQMKQVGSNEHCNILVHLDIKHSGQPKVTKRLYIENNKIWQIGPDYVMDSGSDATLIDSTLWALRDYPSEHFALVLWNHGSGDLNPILRRTINPSQLFKYNPETGLIDLDRSIGFIDFIDQLAEAEQQGASDVINRIDAADHEVNHLPPQCGCRGICFDETNGTYLDDAKLMNAFKNIVKALGRKIDLIIFDACLMAGTGTAWMMSQFANYMVGSEDVVPGTGYNYKLVLEALANGTITPRAFATHIVNAFHTTYSTQTNDYTHSAFDLAEFSAVSYNIGTLAQLLMEALRKQKHDSVKQVIKKCRSRQTCTYFDEPSYIDLWNFYENLLRSVDQIVLNGKQDTTDMIAALKKTLQEGIACMQQLIIANTAGKNLPGAHGLSIFFPEFQITRPSYQSYDATEFARHNHWSSFLHRYFQ